MIIKLVLEKAYDILSWGFIEETLLDASLPMKTISAIMHLITGGSCRLIWNMESTDSIKPSRGFAKVTYCCHMSSCST